MIGDDQSLFTLFRFEHQEVKPWRSPSTTNSSHFGHKAITEKRKITDYYVNKQRINFIGLMMKKKTTQIMDIWIFKLKFQNFYFIILQ